MPDTTVAPEASGMADLIKNQFSPPAAPAVAPAPAPAAAPEPPKPAEAPNAPDAPASAAPGKPVATKREFTEEQIAYWKQQDPKHPGWKVVEYVKSQANKTTSELKAEIEKIKAKPVEGVADAGKLKALEDRLTEVLAESKTKDQRVAEADYSRSEEYNSKYLQPYKMEQQRALEEVGRMNFSYTEDGEKKTRPATDADLRKAMALSGSEQDEFITSSFGNSAWRLIARINKLEEIRSESIRATEEHGKNFEKVQAERETLNKKEREDYDRGVAAAHLEFQKDGELGKYFSESETDPEGSQIFKTELEKFDSFRNSPVTPKDAALARARFAGFPRVEHENKKLIAKVSSLEAELAKMRGVDPGTALKTTSGAAPANPDAQGIKQLVAGMKW